MPSYFKPRLTFEEAKKLALDFNEWCARNKWSKYPGIDKWFCYCKRRTPYQTTEQLFQKFFDETK